MDERIAGLLAQYEVEIYRAGRTKGAWILETDKGLKQFCGTPFSEGKVAFEQKVKQFARERGFAQVDGYVATAEGNYLVQGPYGENFILRDWFSGEECDARNTAHVQKAVAALAELHNCLTGMELSEEEQELVSQSNLAEVLERRNRELRRVRTYIRSKKQKNSFEQKFLEQFSVQYAQAERAALLLDEKEYNDYRDKCRKEGRMLHGNYTHHSVLFLEETTAVIGFDKSVAGIQIQDFYQIFRKVMEKWDWEEELGRQMLAAYESIRPIPKEEKRILAILLTYPEKFWKVANQYYNNRKSWIPEKNMQKLLQTMEQAKKKEETICSIFDPEQYRD